MHTSELEVWAQVERYHDFRGQALHHELVRLALAGHPAAVPFYRLVLAGLGRRLSEWGCLLQIQFGAGECPDQQHARAA